MILGLLAVLLPAHTVPRSEFRVPRGSEISRTRNVERGTRNVHDVHLTHTRMVLDGKLVACRVRLFKDDLEKALQAFGKQPQFHITAEARADSLFAAYFNQTVTLVADGQRVSLTVSASGTEKDPSAQEVVWYVLEGSSGAAVQRLGLLNGLLFELFRDQQNLVQLLREPGGIRKTLYFVSTDPRSQEVAFGVAGRGS
jgi:hypothetical protein